MRIWRVSEKVRCPLWECECRCPCHSMNKFCTNLKPCCDHVDIYVSQYHPTRNRYIDYLIVSDGLHIYS